MVLEQERTLYDAYLNEWLQRYADRWVLVRGQELIGVFNTVEEALVEGTRRFGLTPFLVRQVTPSQEPVRIPALALGVLGSRER
jgi:hypothetical protein